MINRKIVTSLIFIVSIVVLAVSCQKIEDIPEQYMRGGNSLVIATDGNLVIAGYNSTSGKGYDATLIKASTSNGDTLWSRKYGSAYSDAFYSVCKGNKTGYVATGFSNQSLASSPRMLVVITDNDGKLVKSSLFGGNNTQGFSITPHNNADSGYLVAGYTEKTDRDIYLVRIKNDGSVLWEKSYGARKAADTLHDAAYKVLAAKDGGYFITGSLNGYNSCCGRIFLMKVSFKGDSLWTKTFERGIGSSITYTSDGNLAIAGTLQEGTGNDLVLLKTDSDGKLLWKKVFIGTGYEYGSSLVEATDKGLVMVGVTNSKGNGRDDIYLLKTSSSGELVWDKTFGGTDVDQGYALVPMTDGGLCFTGISNSGGSYIFLNRVDASGNQAINWPEPKYLK